MRIILAILCICLTSTCQAGYKENLIDLKKASDKLTIHEKPYTVTIATDETMFIVYQKDKMLNTKAMWLPIKSWPQLKQMINELLEKK